MKIRLSILLCLLSVGPQLHAQNAGGIAPTPPTGLDNMEGPPIGGLQVGMDQAAMVAAYGDHQPPAWAGNDPTYGRHIELSKLPHEEGAYTTMKVSVYLTTRQRLLVARFL
jgi:hypothetical protein